VCTREPFLLICGLTFAGPPGEVSTFRIAPSAFAKM